MKYRVKRVPITGEVIIKLVLENEDEQKYLWQCLNGDKFAQASDVEVDGRNFNPENVTGDYGLWDEIDELLGGEKTYETDY